jgi:uncharacterized membrane protein
MSYLIWKLLHIASVVIFLGNIATGVFWATHANKSGDLKQIATTFDGIIRSDRWFTIPGVIGIIISGTCAAITANLPIFGTGWILWPIILFLISGIVFGLRVGPLQREILVLTRSANNSDQIWADYRKLYASWKLWGSLALLAPIAAMTIMVLKPALLAP